MIKDMFKIDVYYDSWCPMCTSIKKKIEYLDWFRLVNFISFRDGDLKIDIDKSNLEERMHAKIFRNGKIVTDVDAFSAIAIRVPLLVPMYFVLRLSSILGFGKQLYDHIAKKRKIVPVGHCKENCYIKR
ncbi:DUF393 domain-containing protein [Geobacillus stearothermophilus]|nr:DUF393 domain-containing protein [Geobacillus stearothermophilus]